MTEFAEIDESGVVSHVRTISQEAIGRCPFLIMVPEHYRPDESCKCNCPNERARMIREWDYTEEDFRRVGVTP